MISRVYVVGHAQRHVVPLADDRVHHPATGKRRFFFFGAVHKEGISTSTLAWIDAIQINIPRTCGYPLYSVWTILIFLVLTCLGTLLFIFLATMQMLDLDHPVTEHL